MRPMMIRGIRPRQVAIAVAIAAALAGCATTPPSDSAMVQSRAAVATARADANVASRASLELERANRLLAQAESAFAAGDERNSGHLAYLATQQAAIAQETARQRAAEEAVKSASAERDRVVLQIRSREADAARADAARAQDAAQSAQQRAEAARRSAAEEAARRAQAEDQARTAEAAAAAARAQAKEQADEMAAKLADMQARQTARGMVVTLGDVLFQTDRAELQGSAARSLDRLASFMREFPDRTLLIEGYTDSTGSAAYNQALSERRANAVRDALVSRGVDAHRIVAHGLGETSPVASNDTASGRALNRRVEVVISQPPGQPSSGPQARGG